MGAGHAHTLYVHEHSRLHRLAPQVKLATLFVVVASIAITPREAVWAFASYGIVLVTLLRIGHIRLRFVVTRLVGITPFVAFALLLPFIAGGDEIAIFGMSLSIPGLWGAWNVLAKATLGATASILFAATTEVADMLKGMAALRVPAAMIAIAGFMIRYLEVVIDELRRMRVAMTARGYDPRWLWQARPIAAAGGALFIRSYERGERVHQAMLARGYTGQMPSLGEVRPAPADWAAAAGVAAGAVLIAAAAVVVS